MKKIVGFILLLCISVGFSITPYAFAYEENNNISEINSFLDIPDNFWAINEIASLVDNQILTGYPDRNFYPEKGITRAEMAVIISRMMQKEILDVDANEESLFSDVNGDHWAKSYINLATKEGIINGDGNGNFRPEDNITYEEAIKMIICALGNTNKVANIPGDWSAGYLKYATETGIDKNINIQKGVTVDRCTVAVMIYNGLNIKNKYGVKWKVTDAEDLGSRCFDAVGLNAKIGIGSSDGESDFDTIYPWSEIKRCNIKTDKYGNDIITFEGQEGFALDGTNGNVFVRIPKFYVDKYIEDDYEYRVISANGDTIHPAFVENGKELDEIYISAFEGYIKDNKLWSISNVIPTSNEYAQTYLDAAKKNGNNYSLYDMRCVDAIWTLLAVEYGCRNSNRILGYGVSDYFQPVDTAGYSIKNQANTNSITIPKWPEARKIYTPVGSNITICDGTQDNIITQTKLLSISDSEDGKYTTFTFDGKPVNINTNCFIGSAALHTNLTENCGTASLNWHTGRADFIAGSNTMNPIRYRWIENIFGNLWHFIPDITFNNGRMYICSNMDYYRFGSTGSGYVEQNIDFIEQNSNGTKADAVGKNFWIKSMNTELYENGVMFGKEYDQSLTSDKAFGAYYYVSHDGTRLTVNGGGFDHLYRCNILTSRSWILPNIRWYLYGARMMYKKIH